MGGGGRKAAGAAAGPEEAPPARSGSAARALRARGGGRYADSLRSWAVMAKESGSIYRTGVLGTKLTEYLGKEIKKTQMAGSYPPKSAPRPRTRPLGA
mgnify:CR=1 FL=1